MPKYGSAAEHKKQLEEDLEIIKPSKPKHPKAPEPPLPSNIEEIRTRINRYKDRQGAGGALNEEEQKFFNTWKGK